MLGILPLSLYAAATCAATDSTCSLDEPMPARGEALLQHNAQREQSLPERSKAHRRKSAIQLHAAVEVQTKEELPPGAMKLFKEKLCTGESHGGKNSTAEHSSTNSTSNSIASSSAGSSSENSIASSTASRSSHNRSSSGKHSRKQKSSGSSGDTRQRKMSRKDSVPPHSHGAAEGAQESSPSYHGAEDSHKYTSSSDENHGNNEKHEMETDSHAKTSNTLHGVEENDMKSPTSSHGGESEDSQENFHLLTQSNSFDHNFLSEWQSSGNDLVATTATLDDAGLNKVAAMKSDDDMKVYVRRVASSCHMKIIDEGGLNGVLGWFTGKEGDAKFEDLHVALFTALLAESKSHWVDVRNETGISGTTASLDLVGYAQVRALRNAKEMIKFVQRMIENMGIRITNKGGFEGLMAFYSEPDDSGSFQRLMSEIKRAAYEHSWAELE